MISETGFSVYDAVRPYTGHMGTMIGEDEFQKMTRFLLDALVERGTKRAFVRLLTNAPVQIPAGVRFVDDTPASESSNWDTHMVTPQDAIFTEYFIVNDDDEIPVVFIGRQEGRRYSVVLSIDEPLVEMARVILSQYHGQAYTPLNPPNSSYQAAGALVSKFVAQFPARLVSSWLGGALEASGNEQLRAVQQAMGAVGIKWRDQTFGAIPRNNIKYQIVTINVGGYTFEAAGDQSDGEFTTRCHVCAGFLSANELKSAYRSANLDIPMDLLDMDMSSLASFDWLVPTEPDVQDTPQHEPEVREASELDLDALDLESLAVKLDMDFDFPPLPTENGSAVGDDPWAPVGGNKAPGESPTIEVPDISVELLGYINREISYLRDRVLDAGMASATNEKARSALEQFVARSGDLLLLIDEVKYMQQLLEQVQDSLEPVEPYMLLNSLVMTYAGEAERRGVDLHYDAPDELPTINGDAESLNRGLVIMLEQAIERTAPRGDVTVGARLSAPTELQLFIRDTGPALTEDDIAALFKPNFVDANGLSNLGFSALKPIAEAHGGKIRIQRESDLNVISLSLPSGTEG